ncbi:hypothetical protein LshimejAT787_0209740 [Lyophyllum shimeji]|uniref:Uncharacterized protein n=1 Tax=Lyophyllum shimeji TaxID=47721 RepID=A0A9P3UIF3_LYOSH|nr:hypothetical protein LshimejAT787_0209740 [Lyophyllum shimeji]
MRPNKIDIHFARLCSAKAPRSARMTKLTSTTPPLNSLLSLPSSHFIPLKEFLPACSPPTTFDIYRPTGSSNGSSARLIVTCPLPRYSKS